MSNQFYHCQAPTHENKRDHGLPRHFFLCLISVTTTKPWNVSERQGLYKDSFGRIARQQTSSLSFTFVEGRF
jgi:hypothetical protein